MPRLFGLDGVGAVIFDCDGVLVDSEPVSEWAWRTCLAEHGVDMGQDFTPWIGTTDEAIAVHFAPAAGVSPRRLSERCAELFVGHVTDRPLPLFADAAEALTAVEATGWPRAVGTNSERWRLEAILASTGLAGRFAVRVTADDVDHPKPAPDIYLEAVRRLGVAEHRCVVVEDSPTGVEAARAAGLRVVAVDRGVFEPGLLAQATSVVATLVGAVTP